jgi:DNA-binding transcriptional ArsR family regulator
MDQEQFNALLQFFKVMANESRLKLLGHLANGERSVGELAELLSLREPTVSHHLATMKELGLVTVRADGNVRYYRLDSKSLERMSKDVFSHSNLATLVEEGTPPTWEEKVLKAFIKDGRIKDDPTQWKKRNVILHWLAGKITPGVRYSEKEFNELIHHYNADHATWRRYLVEAGLVVREKGVYWRPETEPAAVDA